MELDPYVARLFQIESGGNPSAVTGSNRGLGQFGPQEEARYGITDANRADPQAQAAAVQQEASAHAGVLAKALGRQPTPGEIYLAHQQGIAGGPALLTASPDTPAWQAIRPFYHSDAIAKQAITGNIPRGSPLYGQSADNISAPAFADFWRQKFEGSQAASPASAANGTASTANTANMALPAPHDAIPAATPPFFGQQASGALFPGAQTAQAQQATPGPSMGLSAPMGSPPPIFPQQTQQPRQAPDMSALLAFLQSQGRMT